jgi:hypothetical protein
MVLGYSLAAIILAVIITSIWWRYQVLAKDEALLERLEQNDAATDVVTPPSANAEGHGGQSVTTAPHVS